MPMKIRRSLNNSYLLCAVELNNTAEDVRDLFQLILKPIPHTPRPQRSGGGATKGELDYRLY